MTEDEQIAQIREFEGVNQQEDARILDPGSLYFCKNYYARNRGVLAPRPGSKLIAHQRTYELLIDPKWDFTNSVNNGPGSPGNLEAGFGALLAGTPTTNFQSQHALTFASKSVLNQPRPILAVPGQVGKGLPLGNLPTGTVGPLSPSFLEGGVRVEALARLWTQLGFLNQGGNPNRWLIGVINHEDPAPDSIFTIRDNPSGLATIQTIAAHSGIISVSMAHWSILPYRWVSTTEQIPQAYIGAAEEVGIHGLLTNQHDRPLALVFSNASDTKWHVLAQNITSSETAVSGYVLTAVRALCLYGGAVVYGGFKWVKASNGAILHYDNYICFANPNAYSNIASDTAATYSVPVGEDLNEPVTAMATNSIQTDSQGIKGQLVIFTNKKVRAYDGFPPVSGASQASNFTSVVTGDHGCVAPKTVVRTPYGLIYLGSDGFVYLFPDKGMPIRISRRLEPILRSMSNRRMGTAAAVLDGEWYKLSFASGNVAGITTKSGKGLGWGDNYHRNETFRNDSQFWCDLRGLGSAGKDKDFGAKWYGPMTGQQISCFCVADGPEDKREVFAGWDGSGVVSEVSRADYVTDPDPVTPTTDTRMTNDIIFGEIDMGNPHVSKEIIGVHFGVQTDASADITIRVIALGDDGSASTSGSETRTVKPGAGNAGINTTWGTFVWGVDAWADEKSPFYFSFRPANTIRGRMFRIELSSVPTNTGVGAITVSNQGASYSATPTVTFTGGGGGTGAAASAVVESGKIVRVNITNAGSGYTSSPGIGFTDGTGSGAVAGSALQTAPRVLYTDVAIRWRPVPRID